MGSVTWYPVTGSPIREVDVTGVVFIDNESHGSPVKLGVSNATRGKIVFVSSPNTEAVVWER